MFTGIIQTVGRVGSVDYHDSGRRMWIDAPDFAEGLRLGDSVAVNGVCHTVEVVDGESFSVTSVGETLRRTTVEAMAVGSPVNLEAAATLDTALGGHIVQGHVDGVGTVVRCEQVGDDRMLTLSVPSNVHEICVDQGSITIDGVSLTVVERLSGEAVTITIVPHTWNHTIIKHFQPGTQVNVEADALGKYVMTYLQRISDSKPV